jgi:hypothetical protein
MRRWNLENLCPALFRWLCVSALIFSSPLALRGQQSSVSAWTAADFRIWGYIPYWDDTKVTTTAMTTNYAHVSDVLFFGSARPDATGFITNLYPNTTNTLRSQAQTYGFNLHLSFMAVSGSLGVDPTWRSITSTPAYRQNFVNGVKSLMNGAAGTADDMKGFNFDWERPATDDEWENYTQLARELRAALNPTGTEGREVTVCDYGSTDSDWDDRATFDAKVYDQLMMMVYHINATDTDKWAKTKYALNLQGTAKAFSPDQVAVGVGTWGTGGPATVGLSAIVAANPNLPYDALTYTGTINGNTGTWTIESRKQVREKTQYALDNGMPGMFTWDLTYDASNNLGLHRVMHHYTVVKRDVPDLNLDGKVNSTDATTLANNMGTSTTNTGMTTAAQFDAYYLNGNWEKGDRDGNGFINQADADWLAGRYTALGVTLPDRLAYSGTFETFTNAIGTTGRWRAGRNAQNKLVETGNFKQEATNFLSWSGTGVGASKRSNSFVTARNQNSTETTAGVNGQARTMQADLSTNFDTGTSIDRYVTFLVRENTAGLSAAQLASSNRKVTLDFLDSTGATQFDFALLGLQQQFVIDSVADTTGQDVSMGGFSANTTYLFVGKISANGRNANKMQASLFPTGSVVANFTDPMFSWMLTASSSSSFNPTITDLQFTSQADSSFTFSNVWIGDASAMLPATLTSQGDFNSDGTANLADYVVWRKTMGQSGSSLAADGNGNYVVDTMDYSVWASRFGQSSGAGAAGLGSEFLSSAVPEPAGFVLTLIAAIMGCSLRRR